MHLYNELANYKNKISNIKQNLNKTVFKDHLKLMVRKGEAWKRVLIHIYYIIDFKDFNEINIRELEYSLGVNPKTIRRDLLPGLIERGLLKIKMLHNNAYIYELTLRGKIYANKTIKNWRKIHLKAFSTLLQNINVLKEK